METEEKIFLQEQIFTKNAQIKNWKADGVMNICVHI